MIKKGDTVKVYSDPITCKDFEFTGEVKKILRDSLDGLVYCRVYDDSYEQSFDRQINIDNH